MTAMCRDGHTWALSTRRGAAARGGGILQALRQTQLDQGKVLEAHSKVLEAHSKMLFEHGKVLGVLVSGQVAIMEHLGMNPPEAAADGD